MPTCKIFLFLFSNLKCITVAHLNNVNWIPAALVRSDVGKRIERRWKEQDEKLISMARWFGISMNNDKTGVYEATTGSDRYARH